MWAASVAHGDRRTTRHLSPDSEKFLSAKVEVKAAFHSPLGDTDFEFGSPQNALRGKRSYPVITPRGRNLRGLFHIGIFDKHLI